LGGNGAASYRVGPGIPTGCPPIRKSGNAKRDGRRKAMAKSTAQSTTASDATGDNIPEVGNLCKEIMKAKDWFKPYRISITKPRAKALAWLARYYIINECNTKNLRQSPMRDLLEKEHEFILELSNIYHDMVALDGRNANEVVFWEYANPPCDDDVNKRWISAIAKEMESGCGKAEAIRLVVKGMPDLHEQYLHTKSTTTRKYIDEGANWAAKRRRDNESFREIKRFKKKSCGLGYNLYSIKNCYRFEIGPCVSSPRKKATPGPAKDFYSTDAILYVLAKTVGELNPKLSPGNIAKVVLEILMITGGIGRHSGLKAKTLQSIIDRVDREARESEQKIMSGSQPEYLFIRISVEPRSHPVA
jgi:hypothetical protein